MLKSYVTIDKILRQLSQLEANLLGSAASLNSEFGNPKTALEQGQKALELNIEVYGDSSQKVAYSYVQLATILEEDKQYNESLRYYERAFELYKQLFGLKHPKTAYSMGMLGACHGFVGNKKLSLQLLGEALEILRNDDNMNLTVVGKMINDTGVVLSELKDYKGALERYEEGLQLVLEAYGDRHPNIANALSNIGNVYENLLDRQSALEYHEKALSIRIELLGEFNRMTAWSLSNLGWIYYKNGNVQVALGYMERSLLVRRKLLGDSHEETMNTVVGVSRMLRMLGKRDEAYNLIDETLKQQRHNIPAAKGLRNERQRLLAKPLRPGFKQPSAKTQKKRRKKKRH